MFTKLNQCIGAISFRFSFVGLVFATLLFAFSLTPSLVPRPFVFQGIISGLSFTVGYVAGVFLQWLWYYLGLPSWPETLKRIARAAVTGLCALVAVFFLWKASYWQDEIRALMQMPPASGLPSFFIAIIAIGVFLFLYSITRVLKQLARFIKRQLLPLVSEHLAIAVSVFVVGWLTWSLVNGVLVANMLRIANQSYQQLDALIEDDLPQPQQHIYTGSPDSLIAWRTLGRQGRSFVSSVPSAEAMNRFFATTVMQPLRVYVGMNSAETVEERAQLALQELIRVKAFERELLVLVTPTGTGWVDPAAIEPLEYLLRGNMASVAAQYSYLPSPLSLLTEAEYGEEMAQALFKAVYGHWTELPRETRPRLFLHGLSLGSFNSDLSFDVYDIIQDPFDGALWSGPPFRAKTWRNVTAQRHPSSPAWLPVFRDGSVVRFFNQWGGHEEYAQPWGSFRIAFLQYASDPITFFTPQAFFKAPSWLTSERAADVSTHLRWYPVVTMLQLAADMLILSTPPGFGHVFSAQHYLATWYELVEPDGWTSADLARLQQVFAGR